MKYPCPHCGGEIEPAKMLGSVKSEARARASRANAKKAREAKERKRSQQSDVSSS